MIGDDNHDGDQPETSNPSQVIPPPTSQLLHTVSSIKLSILKKGEYDIWAMEMEHYLCHTDYLIWQVIYNGNGPVSVTTDTNGMIKVLPPKTAKEVVARENERKSRNTLLMALPEDHLAKFHKMADAKEMWKLSNPDLVAMMIQEDAEIFVEATIHGAGVSHEDANQKFLRSLPSSWSQVALIMRTKPGLDTLSFDDLYNNLRVFERDVKGTTASSSSNTQNVAFMSADNTSSTNDVSTVYSVSSPSVSKLQKEGSASYTDEVIHSFFANQSIAPQLDCDDLEQINDDDLEEMDLKWQVAMISIRIKKFHKRTGRKLQFDTKDPVGFDKTKVECFNCHKIRHFARDCRAKENQDSRRRDAGYNGNKARDTSRRPAYQDDSKALVTIDGEDIDSEALKEKEDLKTKVKNWQNPSKILNRLLNTQMSANDKFGLGYGDYGYGSILSYENEVLQSVFMNKECDLENTHVNDKYAEGMHTTSVDESDSKPVEYASSDSDSSVETTTSMSAPVDNAPKIIYEPKVWTDDPIIKEYESDSDDDSVSNVPEEKEKPSFVFTNTAKHVKTSKENVKDTGTPTHCPKVKKQVNAARLNNSSQAASTSTDSKVNTARPFMNDTRPKKCFYKSHSPNKRPFHNKTAQRHTFSNHKVNTVNSSLSAVKENEDTAVKASTYYQEFMGSSIAFGGSNGRITGKGKIKAGRLDFEDVYYMKELKNYNLFSVSQMCDKKNKVLFTDTDCLVLSPDFKLPDENQVLLKIPRQHNMYSFNLKNIDPSGDFSCLFVKASIDKSNKWHRRLGYVNFKNLNKLVKGNLVRGLPSKIFENDHTCVACQKGRQYKASCKAKTVSFVNKPLQILHMDLFRPTSVRSINHKTYSLVITDGFSRIKREYSNAKTQQQNRVAKRKNMTLIEAARTMLADSFLPTTFWVEAVNTACYVLNRVLVTKPQNKTPYELLTGRQPIISFLRPFGCHVTILNTIDQLGKFDGKSDSGFLVGYSLNSKAFREELEKLQRQEKEANDALRKEATHDSPDANTTSTNLLNAVGAPVSAVSPFRALNDAEPLYPDDPLMPHLEDIFANTSAWIFTNSSYDDEGVVNDFNNLKTTVNVRPTPTTRIHAIHPKTQILRDPLSAVQIRSKVYKNFEAHALIEPKKISQALEDESWVYAMQENKKDERGVVVINKARLVAQGHRQEEGINYDEVFAPVARIEAIRIFLAFAFYMGFIVYQIDVKSAYLYGRIDEEVYVTQPPGFVDPKFPNKAQQHISNESPIIGVNTPGCDEDSIKLKELMVFFVQFVLRKMELELLLVIYFNAAQRKLTTSS
nr:hypothetical protein [Tanacetum cinerariifolium]